MVRDSLQTSFFEHLHSKHIFIVENNSLFHFLDILFTRLSNWCLGRSAYRKVIHPLQELSIIDSCLSSYFHVANSLVSQATDHVNGFFRKHMVRTVFCSPFLRTVYINWHLKLSMVFLAQVVPARLMRQTILFKMRLVEHQMYVQSNHLKKFLVAEH